MSNQFGVMLGDLPWPYNARLRGPGRTAFGGGASGHYNCMSESDLWDLGPSVLSVLADRAAVFMWVTGPRQDFAMDLFRHWGLKYCTIAFSWVKLSRDGRPRVLPGCYTGSNKEDVWLLTHNRRMLSPKMTPRSANGRLLTPQIYDESAYDREETDHKLIQAMQTEEGFVRVFGTVPREHSRKPDEIRERVVQMYPDVRRIELFARTSHPDYTCVGNEIDGLDIREALYRLANSQYSETAPSLKTSALNQHIRRRHTQQAQKAYRLSKCFVY